MTQNVNETFERLVDGFDTAMLVSHGLDGSLHARPMQVMGNDGAGTLWFAVGRHAHKIEEITNDPRVAVTMQGNGRFLSISGVVSLVDDRAKAQALWSESLLPWFPAGPNDPNLGLLRLQAASADYWDQSARQAFRYLYDAAKSVWTGEEVGTTGVDHAHVDLKGTTDRRR